MTARALTSSGPAPTARARALAGPAAYAVGVGAATLLVRRTGGDLGLPVCVFHSVTGLACPFCGGMRAVAALTHGDLLAALSLNMPVVLGLAAAVVFWATQVVAATAGRRPRHPDLSLRLLGVLALALLVFTVWRNVPALPGALWLAP